MVSDLRLSGVVDSEKTFESLIAIDETGVHSSSIPTVVAASFIVRRRSEDIVRNLIDSGAKPWLQKSSDLGTSEINNFFDSVTVPTRAQATWGSPTHSQRGLMAMEAVKDVIPIGDREYGSVENCLVLLDGSPSNFGGEDKLLQSRTEILDTYFEEKYGVSIEVATLERADRRYPEVTAADCACKIFQDRLQSGTSIEELLAIRRFDASRSVPAVEYDDRIYKLAPQGVSTEDSFVSKVAAWISGKRASRSQLGDVTKGQFDALVQGSLTDEDVSQYITETERQLRSQQV